MSSVTADALPLSDGCVQTTVTSPPYWGQRDYGYAGQAGIESCYLDYLNWWGCVATEIRRVTKDDGTLWLVIGDTFNTRTVIRPSAHQGGLGHSNASISSTFAQHRDEGLVRYSARQPGLKDKDLMGMPWRMAMLCQDVGWWLRCDIIWQKPWGTSENAPDRPARNHEYVFLFAKSQKNVKSWRTTWIKQNRSVWKIAPRRVRSGPAAFPDDLVRKCVEATTDIGDLVLDPFAGSGTTPRVAHEMGRRFAGFDAAPLSLVTKWGR